MTVVLSVEGMGTVGPCMFVFNQAFVPIKSIIACLSRLCCAS